MRKINFVFLALITFFLFNSCEKNSSKKPEFNRVVVLYMAANNNLSSFAEHNFDALKEGFVPVEKSKDILIVYKHFKDENPKLVRLFKNSAGDIIEDIVATYEDQNSANGDVLKAVLNKINKIFPSKEHGLILWSHATGWLPQGYYNSTYNQTFFEDPYKDLVKSFGEDRGVEMELKELKAAIPFKLSFIIFDCCLMGGIETIYELKDITDYIIASPTEILAYGFPYDNIMNPLFKSKANLEEACKIFYDYYNNEEGIYRSATIALYKTEELPELARISKVIFNNHRDTIQLLDMSKIQRYFRMNKRWYWDLDNFISEIATPKEHAQFNLVLSKVVKAKWSTPSFLDIEINNFCGISTYIQNPGNDFLDAFYENLDWDIDSKMIK
ncbi:MAG: clostripain-related cysteine peptidase [Bacteroidales bacterium]